MKKFLFILLTLLLFSVSVNAVDINDFYYQVYTNLDYPKDKEAKNIVAFTVSPDGIKNIKVLESGGEEFDNSIIKALQKLEFIFVDTDYTIALMFDNERILNTTSDIYLKKSEEQQKYSKRIDIDADFISKELPEWNSFRLKALKAYVKINQDGRAEKVILIQSCGNKDYDEMYIEKIKKRQFKRPYQGLEERDLQFVFEARPLSKAKLAVLSKYNKSVGEIIYNAIPYSQAFKPRNTAIEFTVMRNGQVKNVHIMTDNHSRNYQLKLAKSLTNIRVEAIPNQIGLNSIRFRMIIKKNAEYYPLLDNRSFTIVPLLP